MPSTTMTLLAVQLSAIQAFMTVDSMFSSPLFAADLWSIDTHPMMARTVSPAAPTTPRWRCNEAKCVIALPIEHLHESTVSLMLDDDGKAIALSGEKKIEGCSCKPTDDVKVALPFTPRVEDIASKLENGLLTITLSKHSKMNEPIALEISRPQEPAVNQIRFVPHASASAAAPSTDGSTSTAEQEKKLSEKFRAIAALAVKSEAATDAPEANGTANGTA